MFLNGMFRFDAFVSCFIFLVSVSCIGLMFCCMCFMYQFLFDVYVSVCLRFHVSVSCISSLDHFLFPFTIASLSVCFCLMLLSDCIQRVKRSHKIAERSHKIAERSPEMFG